jgi:DNA phosphorothioation-dependent restriction protein DptF
MRILGKITAAEDNIIRQYYDKELASQSPNRKLCANYRLLCIPEVQERLIDILFKARLMKDQFLTARTLLDFIHNLLVGGENSSGYLFDNLFEESDNELSSKIIEFDPADQRTNTIDKFVLSCSLGLQDEKFEEYTAYLSAELGIRRPNKPRPYSYLRLFYLLKNTDFSNNYHSEFYGDFSESLIDRYSNIWNLHNNFEGAPSNKLKVRAFYRDTVVTAIHKYNNVSKPFFFVAHLKLNENPFQIPININLLKLMEDIVKGYRPNKHDKNTVVLLDELVDQISDIAANSNTLVIVKGSRRFTVKNIDDEDMEVSGYK